MSEDGDKVVDSINALAKAINGYQAQNQRIEGLEDRIHDLETKMDVYENFVSKTSGIFTRVGFYGDAFIIYLRTLWKK